MKKLQPLVWKPALSIDKDSLLIITPTAVEQINLSREQSNAADLMLRIAIEHKPDGSFHYIMGFDEQQHAGDQVLETAAGSLVVDADSVPRANGMTLDYIDLNGRMEFVFMNPNDPNYKPPVDGE